MKNRGGHTVSIVRTVFEKENTDRFDGNVYPPALLELLHKFVDSLVVLVPLSLEKGRENDVTASATRDGGNRCT